MLIDTRLSFLGASLENNEITFIYFMLQSEKVVQNYLTRNADLSWLTNVVFHNLTLFLLKFYDKNLVKIYPRGKMILQTTDAKLAK